MKSNLKKIENNNIVSGAVDRAFGKRNTSEIDKMIQSYFVQMISDIFTTFSTLMSGSRRMEASHLKDIRLDILRVWKYNQ